MSDCCAAPLALGAHPYPAPVFLHGQAPRLALNAALPNNFFGPARRVSSSRTNQIASQQQEHSNAALYGELKLFCRVEERFDR
jgi:hypothetical protein